MFFPTACPFGGKPGRNCLYRSWGWHSWWCSNSDNYVQEDICRRNKEKPGPPPTFLTCRGFKELDDGIADW